MIKYRIEMEHIRKKWTKIEYKYKNIQKKYKR